MKFFCAISLLTDPKIHLVNYSGKWLLSIYPLTCYITPLDGTRKLFNKWYYKEC